MIEIFIWIPEQKCMQIQYTFCTIFVEVHFCIRHGI